MTPDNEGTAVEENKKQPPQLTREDLQNIRPSSASRLFASKAYRRLWIGQCVSSLGDWIGLFAITAIAANIGGNDPAVAIATVLGARMLPGFFMGPIAGVFVDRFDRRRLMVACDVGRAIVIMSLVFVDSVPKLILASILIEMFTLLWMPAKEASVPNLVTKEQLPKANSLSLAAAYGTAPIGAGIFALLVLIPQWASSYQRLADLPLTQQNLALMVDAFTYLVSAFCIAGLPLIHEKSVGKEIPKLRTGVVWNELVQGFEFIHYAPKIRAVIYGLATGIIGGAMIVPIGKLYTSQVLLQNGNASFGVLVVAMGAGMAISVVSMTVLHQRLPIERVFVISVFGAGGSIFLAASMWRVGGAALFVGLLGLFSGAVYVLGFSIIQANTTDELRGRTFAALNTLMRLCIIIALFAGPLLSKLFGRIAVSATGRNPAYLIVGSNTLRLPGPRLTLWLAAIIIFGAGLIAAFSMNKDATPEVAS